MRHERQVELLRQVATGGPRLTGLFGDHSLVNKASNYTDADHFAEELRVLFHAQAVYAGLSCECAGAGSSISMSVAGVPVAIVRRDDGTLGASVTGGPRRGEAVAVGEKYGIVFVSLAGPVDVDAALDGAADDLADFELGGYTHVESRTRTWNVNWKLVLDTFTESYHVRTLHRLSLAPTFVSDPSIFEGFGRNLLSAGLRTSVLDEVTKPQGEWTLLPHSAIQYFLVPNGLVVHQINHVETWLVVPVDPRTTVVTTSIFSPTPPAHDKAVRYWQKNLDILLAVTGDEDFPLMEKIQANLDSGALAEVVYGRNEPALVYLHETINGALAAHSSMPRFVANQAL